MGATILFAATVILGAVAVFFAFRAKHHSIEETEKLLKLRTYGILLLYVGFSVHTMGDMLSQSYGKSVELLLESIAHLVILVSFIFFYKMALCAIKNSKEYWFK